ncbi:unnamed protein product [Cylindrotheca closterium]|uniref:Uncharacterized protein n=1 Tax=Cylindrotheca closterium TaxID=2856 RepID=A0AAD2FTN5_9STRA|nr:unnamed protein product [Cylindrotheca closterium]
MVTIRRVQLLLAVCLSGTVKFSESFQSSHIARHDNPRCQFQIPHHTQKNPYSYDSSRLDAATVSSSTSESPSSETKATKSSVTGKVGNWEEIHGNWVLRPPSSETPRALLHFLGGALVGAAPHITYRYMLERLAEKGFLVVATPYQLSFDHLEICDDVITKFEKLAPSVARQYGALPVVGVGHSCGALLQVLITSLFPDTPRAANALMSYNNKPIGEAVPFFEEVFAPAFSSLAAPNGTLPSSNEALKMGINLARIATEGELPSDQQLQQLVSFLPPFQTNANIKIPKTFRQSFEKTFSPSVEALSDAGVLPILNQLFVSLEQIPKLVDEVATGARDFSPPPPAVKASVGKAYRARRTLVLGFKDDGIDESDEIEEILKEAMSITRMKRPMVGVDVQRRSLEGGHATPLLAPPLDVAARAEDILGSDTSQERLLYTQASDTVDSLIEWLEAGNL